MTKQEARIQRDKYLKEFKGMKFKGYPKIMDFIIVPTPLTDSSFKEIIEKYLKHNQIEFVDNSTPEYELLTVFSLRSSGDFVYEKTTQTIAKLNQIADK